MRCNSFDWDSTLSRQRVQPVGSVVGRLSRDAILGIALGSDTKRTGWMKTSDEGVNKLLSNIYWTQRANFMSVPTDCPQRDERLGYSGDGQIYIGAACYLCDTQVSLRVLGYAGSVARVWEPGLGEGQSQQRGQDQGGGASAGVGWE